MGSRRQFILSLAILLAWSFLCPANAQSSSSSSATSSSSFNNDAIAGNTNGGQLVQIVQKATNSVYRVFRTVTAGWLILWCVFLGMAMAFGQATGDDVRNLFFGGAVVVGANVLATAYYAVYFSTTGTGN